MTPQKKEALVALYENGLDVLMVVGTVGYAYLLNDMDLTLSKETMLVIGGSGGTLRILFRKMIKLYFDSRETTP